jgi:signal transduction histidine kinase
VDLAGLRWSRAVVDVLIVAQGLSTAAWVFAIHRSVPAVVVAVLLLVPICAIQLWISRVPGSLRVRRVYRAVAVQALLAVVPVFVFLGYAWNTMPGVPVSNAWLVLRARWAFPLTIAACASQLAFATSVQGAFSWTWPVGMALFILQLYGFTRLGRVVGELHRTRRALSESAVAGERQRFSSDLRGLLSTGLQTIGDRATRARRRLRDRPRDAAADVAELRRVAREALAGMRATAYGYRGGSLPEGSGPVSDRRAIRLADGLVHVLLVLWPVSMALQTLEQRGGWSPLAVLGVASAAGIAGLQLGWLSRVDRPVRAGAARLALGVQAMLVLLPMVFVDDWVPNGRHFLAGSCLLVLRPKAGWAAFAVVVAVDAAWRLQTPGDVGASITSFLGTVCVALGIYAMTLNARLVRELVRLRERLARAAVTAERARFARDLHDLLGLGMSAIALKADLAGRLLTGAPEAAERELAETAEISHTARADLERVVNGYRDLSLADEMRTARATLTAAGVTVRISVPDEPLPVPVQTVLATVLREGVTNVLRHGHGHDCAISLDDRDGSAVLEIVNGGPRPAADGARPGAGLANLADRVAGAGGDFDAGVTPDGSFRLRVSVPIERVT